jgi:hypothetical protein
MRATATAARSAAAVGFQIGRKVLIDTRNAVFQVIVPLYVAGLTFPLLIGPLGEWLDMPNLGHIPASVAAVVSGYLWWKVMIRGAAVEIPVHMLPNWIQRRVARWSVTAPGQETTVHRNFRLMATIGMWAHVFIWVPIEFPVWRNLPDYIAALAVSMSATFIVASSRHFDTFWRKFWGMVLVFVGLRHFLGLAAVTLPSWHSVSEWMGNLSGNEDAVWYLVPIAVVGLIMASKMK